MVTRANVENRQKEGKMAFFGGIHNISLKTRYNSAFEPFQIRFNFSDGFRLVV
jgi:hypothetical protein